MNAGERAYSPIVSVYRDTQTVESLNRIYAVTGQCFPVSGNAYLRRQKQLLKLKLNAEYAKARTTGER